MSMTVRQRPNTADVHGVFEQQMYVISSTEYSGGSYYKFRYIAEWYVAGTKVATVKVYPNAEGCGVFRVEQIVQDFMSITKADQNVSSNQIYTVSIHTLGANSVANSWSINNGENFRKVEMRFKQEYSTTATGNPVVDAVNKIDGEYIDYIMSAGLRRNIKGTPATWDTGIKQFLSDENWLDSYIPLSLASKILSDRQIDSTFRSTTASSVPVVHQDVTLYDVRTFGVLMDGSAPTGSTAVSAWIGTYNSSNVLTASGFITASTSGGTAPGSVTIDNERQQFLGIGPYNLSVQTSVAAVAAEFAAPLATNTVAYYEVFLMKDSSTVPSTGTTSDMASCCYQFTVKGADCMYGVEGYNPITLAWQNSLGAWDYQSFNLVSQKQTTGTKRKTFEQVAGNWDTADASQDFNYRGDQGGLRIAKVNAHQEYTAHTDLWNEDEVDLLETLMLSPNVFLITSQGVTVTPVVITNTSFVFKKNVNERGPFLYQIKFKNAKERPTTKGGTYRGY
jgi:hypothetical protein